MSFWSELLRALGLRFDPDKDGLVVPGIRTTVTQRPRGVRKAADIPEDVVADRSGVALRKRTDTDAGREWELYSVRASGRKADVGQDDVLAVEWSNATKAGVSIDMARYREMKPVYAKGLTTEEASALPEYRGKRGYGPRTLDNYWAAMAEADAGCPTASQWALGTENATQLGDAIS
jgi:hypothetical protein